MTKYPNRYVAHTYEYVKNFIETQSDCKLLSTTYEGCDKKLLIECYCGNKFETTYTKFKGRNQRQCKECGEEIRIAKLTKTDDEFRKQTYELVGYEYEFLEPYVGADINILCQHNECNYKWKVRPSHFLGGTRCPKCAGCNLKTDDEFRKQVYDLVGDEYIFLEKYINRATKLQCLHTVCNNIWGITPQNFLNVNVRCPLCNSSKGEQEIRKHLQCNNGISFKHEYSFDDLLGVGGELLRFDFAIFDKDINLLFLVEYDGEHHYRPIDFKGRGEKYAEEEFKTIQIHDKYKNNYCIKNSISLLRIPYTNFDDIEGILNKQLEKCKNQHSVDEPPMMG